MGDLILAVLVGAKWALVFTISWAMARVALQGDPVATGLIFLALTLELKLSKRS